MSDLKGLKLRERFLTSWREVTRGEKSALTTGIGKRGWRLWLEPPRRTGWPIRAWALKGDPCHLLMEAPEPNLVSGMQCLQGTYTQCRTDSVGFDLQRMKTGLGIEWPLAEPQWIDFCEDYAVSGDADPKREVFPVRLTADGREGRFLLHLFSHGIDHCLWQT